MSQSNAEKVIANSGNATQPVAEVRPIHEATSERTGQATNQPRNSQFQNTRPPGSGGVGSQPKPNRTLMWIALALVFGIGAAGLIWHKSSKHQLSGLPSPESTGEVVPVPSRVDDPAKGLASPAEGALTASVSPASAPASGVVSSIAPKVKVNLEDVLQKVESLATDVKSLLTGHDDHESRIAALESELQALKELQAKAAAPKPAVRRTGATHRPVSTAPVRPPVQQQEDAAQLLSVDVWDGRPSVAVGRTHGGASDVRFLTEGDTQGRVTVKKADVGSQRAVLATDKGEVVLSRDQQ